MIEPDPRVHQSLVRLLRGTGHSLEHHRDEMGALGELTVRPAALVIAALGPGGALAGRTWSALGVLDVPPPIVWTGPSRASAMPLVESGRGMDVLETPLQRPALQGLLARVFGAATPADRWSGLDFLGTVSGDAGRYPPARVLFLAHRVGGSGTLLIQEDAGLWSISLRNGRIVGASGLSGLDHEDGPSVDANAPPLMSWLGQAIGQGASPDDAMNTAGVSIGIAALRAGDAGTAKVSFKDGPPVGAPIQLPTPIPRLLAEAARRCHGATSTRRRLGRHRNGAIRVVPPDDAPETQWGLPPVALRLLRDGANLATLGELLGQARGGETDEVWEGVDLLLCLGMLAIDKGGGERPSSAASAFGTPPVDDIEIEAIVEAPVEAPVDDQAVTLMAALRAIQNQAPWEVLGLVKSDELEPDGIEAAFRRRSSEFHPDRFMNETAAVRRVAQLCFAKVGDARSAMGDEELMIETRQRLRAAEEGRPFSSESDKRRARLVAKRGVVAHRRKQWDEAWRLYTEATEIDGTEVAYEVQRLDSGWRAGELPGAGVIEAVMGLSGLTIGLRIDALALAGEIRMRDGDEAGAYEMFEKVVELNAEHIEARRWLRLRDMRATKGEEDSKKGLSLKGLFSFGRKGSGSAGGDSGR
jgi:hypothetical protein